MATLNGMNVILDSYLTEPGPPVTRYRTWAERLRQPVRVWDLVSRLPRLLRACVTEVSLRPSRSYYLVGNNMLMHPAMFSELMQSNLLAEKGLR